MITDAADVDVFEYVFVSVVAEVSDVTVATVGVTIMDTEVVVNRSEVIPTVDTEVVLIINCEVIPVVPPFSTTENVGLSYVCGVITGPMPMGMGSGDVTGSASTMRMKYSLSFTRVVSETSHTKFPVLFRPLAICPLFVVLSASIRDKSIRLKIRLITCSSSATSLVFRCPVISCGRKGYCNSVKGSYLNHCPSRWFCERIDLFNYYCGNLGWHLVRT